MLQPPTAQLFTLQFPTFPDAMWNEKIDGPRPECFGVQDYELDDARRARQEEAVRSLTCPRTARADASKLLVVFRMPFYSDERFERLIAEASSRGVLIGAPKDGAPEHFTFEHWDLRLLLPKGVTEDNAREILEKNISVMVYFATHDVDDGIMDLSLPPRIQDVRFAGWQGWASDALEAIQLEKRVSGKGYQPAGTAPEWTLAIDPRDFEDAQWAFDCRIVRPRDLSKGHALTLQSLQSTSILQRSRTRHSRTSPTKREREERFSARRVRSWMKSGPSALDRFSMTRRMIARRTRR